MTAPRPQFSEMIDPPADGRIFSRPARALLADCAPSGRVRLDALARWAQDVAYEDIEDAGLEQTALWVVRRCRIQVSRFPRFGERLEVQTYASGLGRMWAERRTTIRPLLSGGGPRATPVDAEPLAGLPAAPPIVEVVSLWIHLDPVRRVPSPITAAEKEVYAQTAGDRRFPHRLTHPRPDGVSTGAGVAGAGQQASTEWVFRRADLDLADHVNNAAYWEPLEEELMAGLGQAAGFEVAAVDAELEFRIPAQPGVVRLVRDGCYRWITDPESGEVYASMALVNASTTSGSN